MTATVTPQFSPRFLHPVANPALTPSPPVDVERGEIDSRAWLPDDVPDTMTPPSPTEIEAARYFSIRYYTLAQFVAVCRTMPRAVAALDAYHLQQVTS